MVTAKSDPQRNGFLSLLNKVMELFKRKPVGLVLGAGHLRSSAEPERRKAKRVQFHNLPSLNRPTTIMPLLPIQIY